MWLTSSSIGRKFVMALTGICLVLFVTFHVLMNAVALIWPTAYNSVCEFLGANWYALVASAGLAFLFIIHIVYALWLTLQNRKARGADRYAVTTRPPQVEWASQNMLVLGIVVIAFLVVHLIQFWAKMQWQELRHAELSVLPVINGTPVPPSMGTLLLQIAFSEIWTPIVYIIGFIALWFHMNHGFWSMLHTIGWNNNVWMPRLKKIGCWWTTIVVLLFTVQAIVFTIHAQNKFYTTDPALQEQYAEYWDGYAQKMNKEFMGDFYKTMKDAKDPMTQRTVQQKYIEENGPEFIKEAQLLDSIGKVQFPAIAPGKNFQEVQQTSMQIGYMIGNSTQQQN